jgi:hypothetical protein
LHLRRDLATSERVGRVADVTVILNNTIHRDVVAFLEEYLIAGDAMDHDVVDRNTERGRETLKAFTERFCPMVANVLLANLIEESSSDTRTYMTTHLGENIPKEAGTVTYQFYFFSCLKEDHVIVSIMLCLD